MLKKLLLLPLAILLLAGCARTLESATATNYFVAHQGGYIGESTVTVDKDQNVAAASFAEWQGPGGWAENNSPDGTTLVDGAVVRVADPLANTGHSDPAIKGYMFYIYNVQNGLGVWSQFTPGAEGFARPSRQFERDFEGLMGNPIRAAAYVAAARADTLVNVTIDGLTVTVGRPASQTVHYGHMNKADPTATYMPLNANAIGYRYNYQATIDFFMANPAANYAAFTMVKAKIALTEDKAIDANADVAAYTAADDSVYMVADAVSGATYSDFPHYALELQAAYKMAIAAQLVAFQK
ncbi:MAG TPA: hypothetical protein DD477_02235 [Spirochaetaceae bacterium]|nr:MAG: hypothetical protein A2Y32_05085 [Spirochaetes bacterium GWF1_60_12]HBO40021.1 hypothetical protein [Spirochaetaceae bacterium]